MRRGAVARREGDLSLIFVLLALDAAGGQPIVV